MEVDHEKYKPPEEKKVEQEGRPVHSVDTDKKAGRSKQDHEVSPPGERVDDEVGSDEAKATRRQE